MKINVNNIEHLERLYNSSNTENANYFGVSIRAVQKAKTSQKFIEYRQQRNIEASELLLVGYSKAINALIRLLDSSDDRIVIQSSRTLITAYQGQKMDILDNWLNVDRILVSIKECSENGNTTSITDVPNIG